MNQILDITITTDRIHYSIKDSKSFNYKTSITGKLEGDENELENIEIIVPLKYLSNFIRLLDLNCEISFDLKWNKNCVLTSKATRNEIPTGDDPAAQPQVNAINNPTNAEFLIADCKLYVLVVTLNIENENKQYEELKKAFTITVHRNKYRCQISNQTENNNLNYLIDPTFDKAHRLFVLAFENEDGRTDFSKYYAPTVEITDYNVLINQKPFFEIPIKKKEETYQEITELIRNSDYTSDNLLNYDYFLNHYKLIAIDLSKQDVDLSRQQINFIGKLKQNATIFFIIEKEEETRLRFSQNFAEVS